MAFGRSNSLSLNTGAVNSSFAAQQQPQQSQAATPGNLFGGGAQTSQPQQSGGLFGNSQAQSSQAPASGSLFGGSLFGGQQNQTQNQQPAQQPATSASSGGLFGGSLFGGQNQNQAQQQPAQQQQPATSASSGGLFGGSIFGGQNQNQAQQQQPASGSLFGGGGGSLFGQTPAQSNNMNKGTSLFGASNTNAGQPQGANLFGASNNNASRGNLFTDNVQPPKPSDQPSQTSLLASSRYGQSQFQPFVTGRLSMGQGAAGPQPTTTPATKLDWKNVKGVTRFNDLADSAKSDIEKMENLVLEQEDFCRRIEAFLPAHQEKVDTLAPDVALIKTKLDDVDQSLQSDAYGVQGSKTTAEKDLTDLLRCARIVANLGQPAQYTTHPASNPSGRLATASWDSTYDVDLVNNYFQPLLASMASLTTTYASNMAEIESHVGTIEQSAIAQAQELGNARNGLGGERDVGRDSVRQLADTLRGFEESILAAAGRVGECREGINELVIGRMGVSGRRW